MTDLKARLLPPVPRLRRRRRPRRVSAPLRLAIRLGVGTEGRHYLHMILVVYATLGVFLIRAARNPAAHRSLLLFTAWSSAAHGLLMAWQSIALHQHGHLFGDVAAMLVLAVGLAVLMPEEIPATT
jgi:hypothetical protein